MDTEMLMFTFGFLTFVFGFVCAALFDKVSKLQTKIKELSEDYNKALKEAPSEKIITKICNLSTEYTEQVVLRENINPIVQEYIDKRAELIQSGQWTGEKINEVHDYYEAKFIRDQWDKF